MKGTLKFLPVCGVMVLAVLFAAGCKDLLHPEAEETPTVPAVPTGISAAAESPSSIRVTWDAVPNAARYEIYDGTKTYDTSYPTYVITGLAEKTTYTITVKAGNNAGWSESSSAVQAATPAAAHIPAVPTGLTATAQSATSIRVSWDAVDEATTYEIYDETKAYTTSYTSFLITGLTENTTYTITVKAGNDLGWSAVSSSVQATTLALVVQAPDVPTGVAALVQSTSAIVVSWNAVAGATGYEIYDGADSYTTTQTYKAIGGLQEGTTYFFTVKASNSTGTSAPSSPASATTFSSTPSDPVPAAPTGVTALTGTAEGTVTVSWNGVSGTVKNYVVYYGTSAAEQSNTGGSAADSTRSLTVSGLNADTTYYFIVRAANSAGYGPASTPPASAKTLAAGSGGEPAEPDAPAAPQNVSAAAQSSSSIIISWTAVSGAASYKVYRSATATGTYIEIAVSSTTSHTNTGLNASTTYHYTVCAVDGTGKEGAKSAAVSAATLAPGEEPPPPPARPTGVTATAIGDDSITVSWTAVTGAASYKIYRSSASSGTFTEAVGTSTSASYTDTGRSPSTTYYYKVSALNAAGLESPQSTTAASATTQAAPLAAPQNLSASNTDSESISLTWSSVSGAARYKIYRADSEAGTYSMIDDTVTGTSFTNIGLASSTPYYYQISAVSSAGAEGARSTTLAAETTAAPPARPTGVTATAIGADSITVSWTAVTGAASYKIYRSSASSGTFTEAAGISTTASYTDTGLSPSTTYYYKVSALNAAGLESPQSTPSASATTQAALLPAPQNLSASNTDPGSIALTWSPVSGAALYNIYQSAGGASGTYSKIDTVTAASFTDIGLDPSRTYYYQVSAVDGEGREGGKAAISKITSNVQGPTKVPASNISDALVWLTANAESGVSYLVDLTASTTIAPATLSYTGVTNVTITLRGSGSARVVSLNTSNTGSLFTIDSGVTVILDTKITLNGYSTNTAPLVKVNTGGKLIMNEGSKITGNTNRSSSTTGEGGGLYVSGTFIMNGGEVIGNTSYQFGQYYTGAAYGGGVYVSSTGSFTMDGGKIGNNTADGFYASGGGIYIAGNFSMNNGEISGNTSSARSYSSRGGGVALASAGTFTMNGGEISNNTATGVYSTGTGGGGVYVAGNSTFTLSSGKISGNTCSGPSSSYTYNGGGVHVDNTGVFDMAGGTISGNTGTYGGGVYVNTSGVFTKAAAVGCYIYGSDAATTALKNTATKGDTYGHAVYVATSPAKKRDTTAGIAVSLSNSGGGDWE